MLCLDKIIGMCLRFTLKRMGLVVHSLKPINLILDFIGISSEPTVLNLYQHSVLWSVLERRPPGTTYKPESIPELRRKTVLAQLAAIVTNSSGTDFYDPQIFDKVFDPDDPLCHIDIYHILMNVVQRTFWTKDEPSLEDNLIVNIQTIERAASECGDEVLLK